MRGELRRGIWDDSGRGSGRALGRLWEGSGRALEGSGGALGELWGREGSRGVWEGLSPLIGTTLQPFAKVPFLSSFYDVFLKCHSPSTV